METDESLKLDNLILGEIQVLLAEKRTSLAALRTGSAVFALPLSVLSVLIATSHYYNFGKVMPLLVPLLLLADLSFHPPPSPIRPPHQRAHPEISVNRGVCRLVSQRNVLSQTAGVSA